MKSHQTKAASFLIGAFAMIVLVISASTSFGFFYNFFDALVPPALLGREAGALISGAVGVLLFDVACAIWLYTFLHHAETAEQRAITLIMVTATFLGAAAASVAHLALSASGGYFIAEEAAKQNIGLMALVVVVIGVVADFGATLMYQRFSQENKEAVREADRRDRILQAEDEQARELDDLVTQKVKGKLTSVADNLAEQQAARLAAAFQRREGAKYGSPETHETGGGDLDRPLDDSGVTLRDLQRQRPTMNGHAARPQRPENFS